MTNCKNCGAPLSYDAGRWHCQYCNTIYHGVTDEMNVMINGAKFYIGNIQCERLFVDKVTDKNGRVHLDAIYKRKVTLIEY